MSATKVAVSLDDALLRQLDRLVKTRSFRSRSAAIKQAVAEKISRSDKRRFARECAKLDPKTEQSLAVERLAAEVEWPKY